MIRKLRRIAVVVLLLGWFTAFAWASPHSVDSSTSDAPTGSSAQRKVFYDEVHGRHWLFQFNGAALEYSYSPDGSSWTSAGTLAYATNSFAVTYKEIAGVGYVYLVAEANNYDVVALRGTLGASAIVFSAPQTAFDGTAITNRYEKPTIALDASNNIWIASLHRTVGKEATVRRTTNSNDLTAWNAATTLGRNSTDLTTVVLMPRVGAEMYLIAAVDDGAILGYTFDGANWSSANTGGDYSWLTFGNNGLTGTVYAFAVLGSDLYVGGSFTDGAGDSSIDNIARWDGNKWNPLGSGLGGQVNALVVSNGILYAGGTFSNAGGDVAADMIAKWDGSSWSSVGGGLSAGVLTLAASGSDIYAGGSFLNAGTIEEADYIARFDGTSWSALGDGLNAAVRAIDISGNKIFAGGDFTDAGEDTDADRIAYFESGTWYPMGTGAGASVNAIDISGDDVYVGGNFADLSGVAAADYVARWDIVDENWNALGNSTMSGSFGNFIRAVKVIGSDVYIAGSFLNVSGIGAADRIARFNGVNWSAVTATASAEFSSNVHALGAYDSKLVLGFASQVNSSPQIRYIASWDGAQWGAFGTDTLNGRVQAVAFYGNNIFFGGNFENAGGVNAADKLARFDGINWYSLGNSLGTGSGTYVSALAVYGDDLYVGGDFDNAGGIGAADNFARWDITDQAWNSVAGTYTAVYSMAVEGSNLYVAGNFVNAGGNANADYIARWDGASWNSLGVGAVTSFAYRVVAEGSDVYVVGGFENVAGIAEADYLAHWNGSAWSAVGGGMTEMASAIAVFQGDLYICGTLQNIGGNPDADYLARWDGVSWNSVGVSFNGAVANLAATDDTLYVIGDFFDLDGNPDADYGVSYDGTTWSPLDKGVSMQLDSVTVHGDDVYISSVGNMTINSTGKKGYFAKYTPVIAKDADTSSEFSLVTNADGDLLLSYTNSSDYLNFLQFDEGAGSWGDLVTVTAATTTSPNLSLNSATGKLTLSWIEDSAVKASSAIAPYSSSSWATPATVYNTGTNRAVVGGALQYGDELSIIWVNGTSGPYSLLSEFVDATKPTVSITSTESVLTNKNPIPFTITFNEPVTGYTLADFSATNGTLYSFSGSGSSYEMKVVPTSDGVVTVDVAAGSAIDAFSNQNTAATQFSITYDGTAPVPSIALSNSSAASEKSRNLTVNFSEDISGFSLADITVVNGSASNLVVSNARSYTAKITAAAEGRVTVKFNADKVADSAGNGNTAATSVFFNYRTSKSTEPVDDEELPSTICSTWNSFFSGDDGRVWNIMEHVNMSSAPIDVLTTFYGNDGVAQSNVRFSVASGNQFDLLVHDMPGWVPDSYGLVCSEVLGGNPGDLGGQMVYYKRDATDAFEYVFAAPFTGGLSGRQYVGFNTYHPSLNPDDGENLVANWIRITNLDSARQAGTLRYFDQLGNLLATRRVEIPARGQSDQAAHEWGENQVGLVEWIPDDAEVAFIVVNTRYLYTSPIPVDSFDGVFQIQASNGSQELVSGVLDTAGMSSIIEVANITDATVSAVVTIYNESGREVAQLPLTIDAYESRHIIADLILAGGSGVATIYVPDADEKKIIASIYQYGRNSAGEITYLFGIPAKVARGKIISGSYNTYLGQSCDLFISNPTPLTHSVEISMTRSDGTEVIEDSELVLSPYSSVISNICALENQPSYGVLTLDIDAASTLNAHIVRSGQGDSYRYPISVR